MRVLARLLTPLQGIGMAALLVWALRSVEFGETLATTDKFVAAPVPMAFSVAVTTVISGWSTMSLNICDISRYAKSERAQAIGQAIGFVLPNTAVAAVGIFVTAAATVLFPGADNLWNFTSLFCHWPAWVGAPASVVLSLSILSHNLIANVISPANDLANLAPNLISFRSGALIAILLASLLMPWRILADPTGYLRKFILSYSMFTGSILAIMLVDFYIIRKRALVITGLYDRGSGGLYFYHHGFNPKAWVALVVAVLPCVPGFVMRITGDSSDGSDLSVVFQALYSVSWFVSFAVASTVYLAANYIWPLSVEHRAHQSGLPVKIFLQFLMLESTIWP